jgi:hypothetical protein
MGGPRFQVHFLSPYATASPPDASSTTTKPSLEAARSEARAHAARVSHPGARGGRSQRSRVGAPKSATSSNSGTKPTSSYRKIKFQFHVNGAVQPSPSPTLPIVKLRVDLETDENTPPVASQGSRKEDDDDLAKIKLKAASVSPSLPREISRSALDPFVRPPFELSVPDEHLLQVYLSTVPDQIYGSAAPDVSAAIRHGTVGVVATNDLVVMWLLLVIESQVVSFQPTARDRRLSILARRSLAYRLMNERLADPKQSLTDEYIMAVAGAGASELRMGNSKGAECHIQAARKLLELRGGMKALRDITYPLGLMILNVFVQNGIGSLWKTEEELREKVAEFSRWIREVQTWNFTIRDHSATNRKSRDGHSTPESDHDDGPAWSQQTARARAFAPKTSLSNYITLPPGDLDNEGYRFYFGILFALNRALHAFRNSDRTTTAYLAGLTCAVEMSAAHNFTLRAGGAKLPSLLLLLMIAHHAVEVGERTERTEGVFHVEEIFELLEIVMLAGRGTRMLVLRAFASWLTTPIASTADLEFVNNSKLDILAGEVEEKWLESSARESTERST